MDSFYFIGLTADAGAAFFLQKNIGEFAASTSGSVNNFFENFFINQVGSPHRIIFCHHVYHYNVYYQGTFNTITSFYIIIWTLPLKVKLQMQDHPVSSSLAGSVFGMFILTPAVFV